MADGESARLQDHALGHAQHDHVKSIPSPIPKIVYEAPSFRTFQETKKSKLLRQVQTEDYRPSRQPQSRLESFGRLNFDSENIVERAGSPVTLTGPVVTDANASASSEWQRPSSIPAHQPWGETFIGRSDTMSSVRSLDRCASPTKRPLPRPPTGVAPSKSLDRGAPDRSQAGTTSPAIVLVAPPIEVNDTPDDYAETIISDKRNYLASLPSDVILGDAATILPNPGTSAKASLQPSLPLQGGMSYSHSPVITVSTGSLRDPSGFKDSPIGADVAIICAACDGPVIGRTVNAMSQHFHPECYRCAQCGERLEHVSSYEWEGKAFCHLDYHDVSVLRDSSAKLTECRNSPIDVTTARRQLWSHGSSLSMMKCWDGASTTSCTSSAVNAGTPSCIPQTPRRQERKVRPRRQVPSLSTKATHTANGATSDCISPNAEPANYRSPMQHLKPSDRIGIRNASFVA